MPGYINLKNFRRANGTFDLKECFNTFLEKYKDNNAFVSENYCKAVDYLEIIELIHPIKSRQVCASVIAQAYMVFEYGN